MTRKKKKKTECSWMYIDPDCDDLHIAHRWNIDIPSGVTRHKTVKSSMCLHNLLSGL